MADKKAPLTDEEKAAKAEADAAAKAEADAAAKAEADAVLATSPYKVHRNFRCDGILYEQGQEVEVTAAFAKRYESRLTPVRSK